MSTPQAKRRRLNEASTTLRKPFKSPFRTLSKSNAPSKETLIPSPKHSTTSISTPDAKPCTSTPTLMKSDIRQSASYSPTTLAHASPKKTTPSIAREIMALRSDIQMLTQAHSLATSTKDEDLTRLIDIWRTASRAAAEELFAGTRDRVNQMGGVAGWKQREREQKEWRRKMDREAMEAELERRNAEIKDDERPGDEGERYNTCQYDCDEQVGKDGEDDIQGNDDDSFTMDMMLKTLNIDLDLIGYNKEAQRWDG